MGWIWSDLSGWDEKPKGKRTVVRIYNGAERHGDSVYAVEDIHLDSLKDFVERLGKSDMQISIAEANRRKAVTDMIVAEIAVSEALQVAAPVSIDEELPFADMVWHSKLGW